MISDGQPFILYLIEESGREREFVCYANGFDHAAEKAVSQYPNAWVYRINRLPKKGDDE